MVGFGGGDLIIEHDCDQNSESVSRLGGSYSVPKESDQEDSEFHLVGSKYFKVLEIEVYLLNK